MRRGLRNNRSFTSSRENSAAAMAIPPPADIPWLETGDKVNLAYLKARQEAFKHGGLRNKFLQSAAQAWNRNDARGAKALSLRGQNENTLMREKHREAARVLYEERNKSQSQGRELYVDLHGLHPEEAVAYLSSCLKEQKSAARAVYAICGTGHHSKNGKDKVGKAVRLFLNEWKYAFREFSVPGDRNNVGGILGIDPSSFDKTKVATSGGSGEDGDSGVGLGDDTKVTVVKEDPRKVSEGS
jgi:DNA-nicking Smr family endonuclease